MKKYYYIINNGKYIKHAIDLEQTVPSGDHLYGWSEVEVKAGTVSYGVKSVAQITPYHELQESIKKDVDALKSCDVEAAVSNKRGWMISDPIESVYSKRTLPSERLNKGFQNIDAIISGLPRQSVGSLVSAGGVGKSMMILDCAMQIAVGRKSYLDDDTIEVRPRTVAYLCLEDPEVILENRMQAISRALKLSAEELELLDKHLIAETVDFCLAEDRTAIPEPLINFFKAGEQVDLIIIDTAILSHNVDENSSSEMKVYVQSLKAVAKALDCVVLVLHHTSKYAAANRANGNDIGASASRGSSALVDNSRAMWALNTMSIKDAEGRGIETKVERKKFVELSLEKGNYQPNGRSVWLERGELGVLSLIPEPTEDKCMEETNKLTESFEAKAKNRKKQNNIFPVQKKVKSWKK